MVSIRVFATLAVGALAISAQAFMIDIISVGGFTNGVGVYATTENVIFQNTPGTLSTLAVAGNINSPGPSQFLNATATYVGSGGSLVVNYSTSPMQTSGNSASYDGIWTYVSGTGAYAGLSGTGAVNFLVSASGFANHSLSGELQAVPEPATMAVLGLGAAALLRRRKRS